jgi:hypothetical protein
MRHVYFDAGPYRFEQGPHQLTFRTYDSINVQVEFTFTLIIYLIFSIITHILLQRNAKYTLILLHKANYV